MRGTIQTPQLVYPAVDKLVDPFLGTRKHVGNQAPLKGVLDPSEYILEVYTAQS